MLKNSYSIRIFQYLQYWKILVIAKIWVLQTPKILGNTGNTNIADTRRFWKILVIPVLQILEDSGKYLLPVSGSTKFKEWFTVRCWRPICCWMPWYARHWSEWIMLSGRINIFNHRPFSGPPILSKKKLNYVLLCFIKLQFKPKCYGIDTIMYNNGRYTGYNSAMCLWMLSKQSCCVLRHLSRHMNLSR
jgi:hypothetical protein